MENDTRPGAPPKRIFGGPNAFRAAGAKAMRATRHHYTKIFTKKQQYLQIHFQGARLRVAIQTPSSGGIIFVEISLFRHCEERSDEAIQKNMAGLLRFARNDKCRAPQNDGGLNSNAYEEANTLP
jgi:hypothetical protein